MCGDWVAGCSNGHRMAESSAETNLCGPCEAIIRQLTLCDPSQLFEKPHHMGKRLYVGNLPYDADEETIRTAFSEGGGTVERVHIPLDRETQRPRGFAFVEMASDEDAQKALAAMDGASMGTRSLRVSEAEERRPGGGPGGGGGRPAGASPPGASSPDDRASTGSGGEAPRETRERRFGPDAKPARIVNRDRSKRGHGRRRNEDSGSDGGRRGGSRFNADFDYD